MDPFQSKWQNNIDVYDISINLLLKQWDIALLIVYAIHLSSELYPGTDTDSWQTPKQVMVAYY